MTQLTDNENRVLACLRGAVEGRTIDKDGITWGDVYLDNAIPDGMSSREFDGTLGSLTKKGLYREYEEAFGMVQI
jgi:hypothetical protein